MRSRHMKFNKIFEIVFMPFLQVIDVLIANFIHDRHAKRYRKFGTNTLQRAIHVCVLLFSITQVKRVFHDFR